MCVPHNVCVECTHAFLVCTHTNKQYAHTRTHCPPQEKNGAVFQSETDTEVVPHLCEYLWRKKNGRVSLHQLVRAAQSFVLMYRPGEVKCASQGYSRLSQYCPHPPAPSPQAMEVCSRLEGAYALLIKSARYPNELVACKQVGPIGFSNTVLWCVLHTCLACRAPASCHVAHQRMLPRTSDALQHRAAPWSMAPRRRRLVCSCGYRLTAPRCSPTRATLWWVQGAGNQLKRPNCLWLGMLCVRTSLKCMGAA